jgi:lysine 2,3-aminomutase
MLAEFAPLYVHTHFNHPAECSVDALKACRILTEAGIPLNNHTVLLKGINDRTETILELNQKLLMMNVRPYYLYQCDQVFGNSEFRTSVSKGLEIIKGLRGWTSGLAVPHYVVDTPGGGKVPLLPNYVVEEKGDSWTLRNYEGKTFTYHEGQDLKA